LTSTKLYCLVAEADVKAVTHFYHSEIAPFIDCKSNALPLRHCAYT